MALDKYNYATKLLSVRCKLAVNYRRLERYLELYLIQSLFTIVGDK